MLYLRKHLQQELLVLGIVDGLFVVSTSKGLDRIPGFPVRDQSELGEAVEEPAQDPDTAIARDGVILLQTGFLQILEISVFIGFTSYASPDTGNHLLGPRLEICRKILAGNRDYDQLGRTPLAAAGAGRSRLHEQNASVSGGVFTLLECGCVY